MNLLNRITRVFALSLLLSSQVSQAETVTVPLQIDFPLLRQLLVQQLFNNSSESTELLHDPNGCSEIVLSDPQLSEAKQHLQIKSRLEARLAVKMLSQCVPLLNWKGSVHLLSDPMIDSANPRVVYLHVIDSELISSDEQRLTTGPLWDKMKKHLHPWFNQFRLDLNPSLKEIKTLLPLFLPTHSRDQLDRLLASLQLSNLRVAENSLQSDLVFEVEGITVTPMPEHPLTEEERRQWQQQWQSMDALLTHAIKHYAAATELEELRQTLFDILLDARYQLLDALQQEHNHDLVRHWFIQSWTKLIPVLRRVSAENPRYANLSVLTLVTASDALQTLDKMGPAFGLDISMDGLRRFARLMNDIPDIDPLLFDEGVDPDLIRLFQFPPEVPSDSHLHINLWPINQAVAAIDRPLNHWIAKPGELESYLLKIRALLLDNAEREIVKGALTSPQQDIFRNLVMATAWQESCWRQYVVEQNKIVPLRSASGDTGIMQINEKVWRGFVDLNRLRWEIAYNIQSGNRILLNYLTRYALKNGEHQRQGGLDNLARASYSAYNGGPGQISRYRNSQVPKTYRMIDQSFQQKYFNVKQGKELTVAACLGSHETIEVKPAKQGKALASSPPQPHQAKKLLHQESWIKRQQPDHYTVQLGAFSSDQGARAFIGQQTVPGNYAISRQRKGGKTHYVVLYGRYSSRQRAAKDARHFDIGKPWIRSYRDLQ